MIALSAAASAVSVTLQPGQTGQLADKKITVLRVQDSRCAPGVQCIRAGELVAKVLMSEQGRCRFLTLQLPEEKNAEWRGVRLGQATFGKQPRLTFTDERR
ncbi:hypothetical protein DVJ83_01780 [Deinococcus wulumuqiensis]|uniref:Uncharacterized protein n=1 Tax=Deinococcus wulumuqiensis TaxID=980427 RepID=A0A345IEH8_9DEIO|nr:hypothetical protein [Deinococcus wulumuqiensis]AXG98100.1 hypothetical protein DVJ83_01780 [Deinococcus wulumuqiensis]